MIPFLSILCCVAQETLWIGLEADYVAAGKSTRAIERLFGVPECQVTYLAA